MDQPNGTAPALPEEKPALGKWMALTAAFLGWMFDGLEMGLFPLIGRPALGEMLSGGGPNVDKEIGTWFGAIIAAFLVGAAAGGFVFGWLGDRIGRVKAMVWSVLTYSVFSGLCVFVNAPWQLFTLRFLASLGMGGEWALGVSLIMEVWPSKSRPVLAGLIGGAANVGFLLVGFLGLGLNTFMTSVTKALHTFLPLAWADALMANNGWRMLCLLGAVPAFLTFFIRIFVPESDKWKHAAKNAPKNRMADIFRGGTWKYSFLGAALAGLALLGTWGSVQWIPAWTGKLTEGVPGVNKGVAMAWTQIYMAIGAIIGTLVIAVLAEKFNRRGTYFALCVVTLAICQYMFRSHQAYGGWFLVLATLANGLSAGFYGWLPLYLPELFPTRIRATGSGFGFNAGRILAAGGTLISGQLLTYFGGDYARMCSVISLIYVAGMVVIWLCPETKGKPLPE